jgi:hypothetical protein
MKRRYAGLTVYFALMVLPEPLFHFLQQLDFTFIACRIGKSPDGPLVIELFIFKAAGEFRNLVVRYQPIILSNVFNSKFFHSPPKSLAALNLLSKSKINGFIFIVARFDVKLAAVPEIESAGSGDCPRSYALKTIKINPKKAS